MRILFIGGTGNISTECAALLHARGHYIQVLTRGRAAVPSAYEAIQADRTNAAGMRAALQGRHPDVIINFLGYEVTDVQLDYDLFKDTIQQYIFISSATVYLKPPPSLPISEDGPFGNPYWDYARKKIDCEQWLRERSQESRFPVTVVRPSHTYSKLWVPNALSSSSYTFAARLEQGKPVFVHDNGETPWTLTASSDFAVGLAGLAGNTKAIGEAVHITSDEVLTWNQIYSQIAEAVGAKSPKIIPVPTDFICEKMPRLTGTLKGDKAYPGVFDTSKIKRLVPDFHCKKNFRQGVRESIEYLRAHPDQKNLKPELDVEIENVLAAWEAKRKTDEQ